LCICRIVRRDWAHRRHDESVEGDAHGMSPS
jgi:hypothetical protein